MGEQTHATELPFRLRPRERAPLDVSASVRADGAAIRWVVRPVEVKASMELDSSSV
jgi:hypothetical protein